MMEIKCIVHLVYFGLLKYVTSKEMDFGIQAIYAVKYCGKHFSCMGQNPDHDTVSCGAENRSKKEEFMVKRIDHDKYLVQNYENFLVKCCCADGNMNLLRLKSEQTTDWYKDLHEVATSGNKRVQIYHLSHYLWLLLTIPVTNGAENVTFNAGRRG